MTEGTGKNSPKDESNSTICTYQNEACYFFIVTKVLVFIAIPF